MLTIALGIGANTAIFSFVSGALLKPLPYAHAERIVNVWEKLPRGGENRTSTLTFLDWQKQASSFSMMAAEVGVPFTLSGREKPAVLHGARVSADYFRIFGVKAVLGGTFAPQQNEAGKNDVAVISCRLWRSRFGGNRRILGEKLVLDGVRGGRSDASGKPLRSWMAGCVDSVELHARGKYALVSLADGVGAAQGRSESGERAAADDDAGGRHGADLSFI